jgi:hypothetical protein
MKPSITTIRRGNTSRVKYDSCGHGTLVAGQAFSGATPSFMEK